MALSIDTKKCSDDFTEDNSPSKISEGQSPVRQIPESFKKQATKTEFAGINLTQMNKDAIDEEVEFTDKNGSANSGKQ